MAIADKVTTAVIGGLTTATKTLDKATTGVVPRGPVGSFDQGFPLGIADVVSITLIVLISMGVAALVTAFSIKLARALGVVAVGPTIAVVVHAIGTVGRAVGGLVVVPAGSGGQTG